MNEEEQLTPEEEQELTQLLGGYPRKSEKEGVFAFLKRVLTTKDTSKVSNLDAQEIYSVRILQSTALYTDEMGLDKVSEYIGKEAEIILGTADSKEGFLIKAAITQKRELETRSKIGGKKGWNKKDFSQK